MGLLEAKKIREETEEALIGETSDYNLLFKRLAYGWEKLPHRNLDMDLEI